MKLRKLFSLALVGISALTGAFMLSGCGEEETKPAEVKALDSVIAQTMEQDFTATITITTAGTDGDGTETGHWNYDKDNEIVQLELMDSEIYAWMNDGKSYWASELFEWVFDSNCVYAKGSKVFDLAKHPSMVVMYDDSFWKGADIATSTDESGNTVIMSTNTIKQSGVNQGMAYDSTMEIETTFVYNEGRIISVAQEVHMVSSVDWDGRTESIDATQNITCTFDYDDVELEVPANIKALEEDASKIDFEYLKAMMQSMTGGM